jgi:hypothetical protein
MVERIEDNFDVQSLSSVLEAYLLRIWTQKRLRELLARMEGMVGEEDAARVVPEYLELFEGDSEVLRLAELSLFACLLWGGRLGVSHKLEGS